MAVTLSTKASESPDVMARLGELCQLRGLPGLGERLQMLGEIAGEDLMWCEAELEALPRLKSPVFSSASHLLDLGGKRLRPLCVALAARAGDGFGAAARELAAAGELVHSATLLHDDGRDLRTRPPGAP